MIRLHQFPADGWGVPNPSPFCMKVETYLRMVGAPYETIGALDMSKAPKGKLPWIEIDGERVADSGAIIARLEGTHGLDAGLSPRELATAHLVRRTLEESLYFVIVYTRWLDESAWAKTKPLFFSSLPAPVRAIAPVVARRAIRKMLVGQGTGRHSYDEVIALGRADIDAIAEVLGAGPFMLGDAPRTIDASAYAFIDNLLHNVVRTPLTAHAAAKPNLVAYAARMRDRYFSSHMQRQ